MSRNYGIPNPEVPPEDDSWIAVPPESGGWWMLMLLTIGIIVVLLGFVAYATARDLGQWENTDPVTKKWFQSLMRPDNPQYSCCGEADAYWADVVEVVNGKIIAVITDERADGPLGRQHEEIGTHYVVPPAKMKFDKGNPTGHIVIFLAGITYTNGVRDRDVYCYVQNGGV
jgi:hypothetical protein